MSQVVRQVVHAMFIANNRTSFHLWGMENLVKHQKVSKYYGNDCRFMLSTDSDEKRTMSSKSDINIIMIVNDTDKIIQKLFA